MSEDERPPRSAALEVPQLSDAQWHGLLCNGDVEIVGRLPWSSNATFLVRVKDEELDAPAVYKPEAGERPLRDFPQGLWRREVAAFELSDVAKLRVIPETVIRTHAPVGEGSLQRFIDADYNEQYFSLLEDERHREALRLIAGFDLLANNADRKGGHLLIDDEAHLWGIDNGLCFHVAPKLRTVMWDFAGEIVPVEILELAQSVLDDFPGKLVDLLYPREQDALRERAAALLDDPSFPQPDPERRAYPWPLV